MPTLPVCWTQATTASMPSPSPTKGRPPRLRPRPSTGSQRAPVSDRSVMAQSWMARRLRQAGFDPDQTAAAVAAVAGLGLAAASRSWTGAASATSRPDHRPCAWIPRPGHLTGCWPARLRRSATKPPERPGRRAGRWSQSPGSPSAARLTEVAISCEMPSISRLVAPIWPIASTASAVADCMVLIWPVICSVGWRSGWRGS